MTTTSTKTVEIKVERTIPAPPSEVFDAWPDPKIPGTHWHENDKLIVNPKVDGLWYWLSLGGTPHYGWFMEIDTKWATFLLRLKTLIEKGKGRRAPDDVQVYVGG